jgi:hypothetical protein
MLLSDVHKVTDEGVAPNILDRLPNFPLLVMSNCLNREPTTKTKMVPVAGEFVELTFTTTGALNEIPWVRPDAARLTETLIEFPSLKDMKFPAESLHTMLLSAFHTEN